MNNVINFYSKKPDDRFELPSLDQLIQDFLTNGGSLKQYLESKAVDLKDQKVLAIQILKALEASPEHQKEFESIRRNRSAVEALLAEDRLVTLATTMDGKEQLSALKLLLERHAKRPPEKEEGERDPMDAALEEIQGR